MGSESVWGYINTRISGCSNNKFPLAKFYVWMAFEGVLMMSRWCLRVSGEASIHNMLAKTMLSYCYIFFQCPVLHENVLCLGVSVLCLGVSW